MNKKVFILIITSLLVFSITTYADNLDIHCTSKDIEKQFILFKKQLKENKCYSEYIDFTRNQNSTSNQQAYSNCLKHNYHIDTYKALTLHKQVRDLHRWHLEVLSYIRDYAYMALINGVEKGTCNERLSDIKSFIKSSISAYGINEQGLKVRTNIINRKIVFLLENRIKDIK